MKISSIIILFLLVLTIFCSVAFAQSLPELEKLKEIKLLESNRDDVRKILAEYKLEDNEKNLYEDKFISQNFEIKVYYSKGKCSESESSIIDLEKGKIEVVNLSPKNDMFPKDLGLKLSKFREEYTYTNSKYSKIFHRKDLGIIISVEGGKVQFLQFEPSKKYYSLLCDQEKAKRILTTKSYFDPTDNREIINDIFPSADVINVIISLPEITASCDDSTGKKYCDRGVKVLTVFAVVENPVNDILIYKYSVTGGKIIEIDGKSVGLSDKVLWDLSGVKPGTYTITAAVDNGCGFCGKTITKTVTVKECADCGQITKP